MSQLKGPPAPLSGNVAAAARQARLQVQRDVNRQVKNTQLGQAQKAQEQAQKPASSSALKTPEKPAGTPQKPSSGLQKAAQQAPKQPIKTSKSAEQKEVERSKAPEVAEMEHAPSDSFTQDTSAINDLRRMLGSVDENTSQANQVGKDHDLFDPNLSAPEVEGLGNLRGAVHMVKLLDHWKQNGVEKSQAVQDAAALLLSFSRPEAARGVLRELDRAPIKAVYPLEVQMALVDLVPDFFPNVSRGTLVENKEALERGDRVLAGHDTRIHFPTTVKLKSFALLTEGRPGYEFEPLRPGLFRLLVDTPGTWQFAIRGEQSGKSVIDTFTVNVRSPGALNVKAPDDDDEDTSMREVVVDG